MPEEQVMVSRLSDLLELREGSAQHVMLGGPSLQLLHHVLADLLLHGRPRTDIPAYRWCSLAAELRVQLPIDRFAAGTDAFVQQLPVGHGGAVVDAPPTPFLPFVVELEGLRRDPGLCDPPASERIHVYVAELLKTIPYSPNDLRAAGLLLAIAIQVLIDVGLLREAMIVAWAAGFVFDEIRTSGRHANEAILAVPDLLDGVYAALDSCWRSEDLADAPQRLAAAQSMLAFVDDVLAPATMTRNALYERIGSEVALRERDRANLVQRHRRLSWAAAVAMERGHLPPDRVEVWEALAVQYDQMGETLDAAGTLSNALDQLIDYVEGSPARLEAARHDVVNLGASIETYLARSAAEASNEAIVDRQKALVRAYITIGTHQAAERMLTEAMVRLDRAVGSGDWYRRNTLLRGADDWIGLAAALDIARTEAPGASFERTYEVVRRRAVEPPVPIVDAVVLRAYVTRTSSFLGTMLDGAATWTTIHEAHELGRSLGLFSALCAEEVRERRKFSTPLPPEPRWGRLLDRLAGQLRLSTVREALSGAGLHGRLLIELDALGLHLPWPGLLLGADVPVRSILVRELGARPATDRRLPAEADPVNVLNAFSPSDSWHNVIRDIGNQLHWPVHIVNTAEQLRAVLARPAKLVLLCCHGSQTQPWGELRIEVGGRYLPVAEVLDGAALPVAATVVCMTCYGGAGFLQAGGEWQSLSALLLRAGARAVVASRWPAWDELETRTAMIRMLTDVHQVSANTETWDIATALTEWMVQSKREGVDPRHWAGWAVWTSSRPDG